MSEREQDQVLDRLRAVDPALEDGADEARVRARVLLRGEAALDSRVPSPSRRVPRIALAGGLTIAAALAAILLVAPGGNDKLNVVAEARAALPEPDELVHYETVTTMSLVDADEAAEQRFAEHARGDWAFAPKRYEQWSTDGRWRVTRDNGKVFPKMFAGDPFIPGTYIPDEELERVGLDQEIIGPTQEAYANGVDSFYVDGADVVVRVDVPDSATLTPSSPGGMFSGAPTILGADPVTAIREQLDSGQLRDAGTAEFDGRTVRRLVGIDGVMEYHVDAETFEPVRVRMFMGWSEPDSQDPAERLVNDTVFEEYETLPLDESTESLLEIDVPAGTAEVQALGPDEQPPRRER
jgi:hypothetical protein